jgi:hypothetical protein
MPDNVNFWYRRRFAQKISLDDPVMAALYDYFRITWSGTDWNTPTPPQASKKLLVANAGDGVLVLAELIFTKALQYAGYEPIILTSRGTWANRLYQWAGIRRFVFWEDYVPSLPPVDPKVELDQLAMQQFEDILNLEYEGVRVGTHATSLVMRNRRAGFDPQAPGIWEELAQVLAKARQFAAAANGVVEAIKPDLALLNERGYIRYGAIFDAVLNSGADLVQWVGSHKDSALILKRYTQDSHMEHPASLSATTWEHVQHMPSKKECAEAVEKELYECYNSGVWFGEVGTQFDKRLFDRPALIEQLGLDPTKKVAIVFAHMFWDASFFYGKDLFRDYQEWFIETIRAAAANPCLNWLIKIHPANTVKNRREGITGELAENAVIHQHLGDLPAHVKIIPADSDINTFSLFSLMDYCLTVRGTIGIEAASFGIPVITAGTGRYDRHGFTIDSANTAEYLDKLSHLHQIPPLTADQHQLAQRFAYASFLMRPFLTQSFRFNFQHDSKATVQAAIVARTLSELLAGDDMQAFVAWASMPEQLDFMCNYGPPQHQE